jgi:hypothetical protein
MKKEILEHKVFFSPAFDKRDPNPSKNYGIGSVRIHFFVKGEKGGIEWTVSTGMFLKKTHAEWLINFPKSEEGDGIGHEIAYHAKKKQHEGQEKHNGDCTLTDLPYCYNDAGFCAGGELYEKFVEQGEEIVWKTLEEWHRELI